MHRARDEWTAFAITMDLCLEVERQNNLRLEDAAVEAVDCLRDLVIAIEPLLIDVPEPERHGAAIEAVRKTFGAAFPQVDFPPLKHRLAQALRLHLHNISFLRRSD